MRPIACVALAAFLLATGGANAEDTQIRTIASIPQGPVSPDQLEAASRFAREASLSGLFDVESAQLALDRASNADVRKLAREILEEQTLANSRLEAFAPKDARTKLDGEYATQLAALKAVKAEEFDRAFMAAQKQSHERSVKLFSAYAQSGEDQRLKSYASETLSFLNLHKSRIDSMQ
jgi:putative membrane protein